MLERWLFVSEKKHHFLKVFFIAFFVCLVLGVVNFFIGGNSLFLVALVSLGLSYPTINYMRSEETVDFVRRRGKVSLFLRAGREMEMFWALFLGSALGIFFLLLFGFGGDFSFQEKFVTGVSGFAVAQEASFFDIFLNNLGVAFFTFVISFLVFSGLVFVLVWNSSVLGFYLYSLGLDGSTVLRFFLMLPHVLFEIGGYVMAGIAGGIVAYAFDRSDKGVVFGSRKFLRDVGFLLFFGFFLVFLGAVVEVF